MSIVYILAGVTDIGITHSSFDCIEQQMNTAERTTGTQIPNSLPKYIKIGFTILTSISKRIICCITDYLVIPC
jgi:hypothetical protein